MTLPQFLAAFAAIIVLLCLFIWQIGKTPSNDTEGGQ